METPYRSLAECSLMPKTIFPVSLSHYSYCEESVGITASLDSSLAMYLRAILIFIFIVQCSAATDASELPTIKPNLFLSNPIDAFLQSGLDNHYSYCPDIFGKPGSNNCDRSLEARSCRIGGEDTQFEFDAASGSIKATNYNTYCSGGAGPCLEVDSIAANANMAMKACSGSANQKFEYANCQLTIGGLCVVVASTTATQTGLKRQLFLADCASTDASRREWTVVTFTNTTITQCFTNASSTGTTAMTSSTAPTGVTSTVLRAAGCIAAVSVAMFFARA